MKKDKDLIYLPRTPESVPTPRERKNAIHVSKSVNIRKPKNFEKALQTLEKTGKIDRNDFSSAADIGAFIDFLNNANEKKQETWAQNEITEISKFLARIMTSKTFTGKKE